MLCGSISYTFHYLLYVNNTIDLFKYKYIFNVLYIIFTVGIIEMVMKCDEIHRPIDSYNPHANGYQRFFNPPLELVFELVFFVFFVDLSSLLGTAVVPLRFKSSFLLAPVVVVVVVDATGLKNESIRI